jgi:hypothetical protein
VALAKLGIFPGSIDTSHNSQLRSFALSRFSCFLPGAALTQGSRPFHVPEMEAGIIPSMSGHGPGHNAYRILMESILDIALVYELMNSKDL